METNRDSEASAPAEFPPEQPEADLAGDEEDYGAEELVDEQADLAAEVTDANGEGAEKEDAAMEGVENGDGEVENGVEEDEMSEAGSVDIEDESEDEIEEEEEVDGEGGEGDEMEVDSEKPEHAPDATTAPEVMAH